MRELSIDIETFSSVPLGGQKSQGVYKYVEADDFDILMVTYGFGDEELVTIDLLSGQQLPQRFIDALTDPTWLKTAWNAAFEIQCLRQYLGIDLDPAQWCCTMVKASYLGLPMGLESAAEVLKLDAQKDKLGKKCIDTFSVPIKPTKSNGMKTRYYPEDNTELWQSYLSYNRTDVVVEMSIRKKIAFFVIPDMERKLWVHDRRLNDLGMRLDVPFIKRAMLMRDETQAKLVKETMLLTGVDNPKSPKQMLAWINTRFGTEFKSLNKEEIPKILEETEEEELLVKVLQNRTQYSKTSLSKFDKMLDIMLKDECVRGVIQINGASKTGRFSAKMLQVHNFTKSYNIYDFDYAKEQALKLSLSSFEFMYGDVLAALSQMMRSCIIAREGHTFQVSDLSAIEARVLAWLAGEQWVLDAFAAGHDIYVVTASRMFDIPIESIADAKGNVLDDVARNKGKVAVLSLGYQGAIGAMIKLGAIRMGICDEDLRIGKEEYKAKVMEQVKTKRGIKTRLKYPKWGDSARIKACVPTLLPLVKSYRAANPEIVKYWYFIEDRIKTCIRTKKPVELTRGMIAFYEKGLLFVKLPSGRCLPYYHAQLVWVTKFCNDEGEPVGGSIIFSNPLKSVLTRTSGGDSKEKPAKEVTQKDEVYWNGRWHFHSGFKETICYNAIDQDTKKWSYIYTYSGSLAENFCQAVARDVLCTQMLRMEDKGHKAVLHVHDEVVIETPKEKVNLKEINDILSSPISWAPGLPLAAKGFVSTHYKKD